MYICGYESKPWYPSVATPRYLKIAGLWLFISQNMVILLLTAFDPSI